MRCACIGSATTRPRPSHRSLRGWTHSGTRASLRRPAQSRPGTGAVSLRRRRWAPIRGTRSCSSGWTALRPTLRTWRRSVAGCDLCQPPSACAFMASARGFIRPTLGLRSFIGSQGRAGLARRPWHRARGARAVVAAGRCDPPPSRRHGRGQDRFGLTHNDLRLANLLIDGDRTYVIDFDDCGDSWYMNDWATAVSMIEHHPQLPAMRMLGRGVPVGRVALARGRSGAAYLRDAQSLSFVAWVGSHHMGFGGGRTRCRLHRRDVPLAEAYLPRGLRRA